jgi:hypothetical protein
LTVTSTPARVWRTSGRRHAGAICRDTAAEAEGDEQRALKDDHPIREQFLRAMPGGVLDLLGHIGHGLRADLDVADLCGAGLEVAFATAKV